MACEEKPIQTEKSVDLDEVGRLQRQLTAAQNEKNQLKHQMEQTVMGQNKEKQHQLSMEREVADLKEKLRRAQQAPPPAAPTQDNRQLQEKDMENRKLQSQLSALQKQLQQQQQLINEQQRQVPVQDASFPAGGRVGGLGGATPALAPVAPPVNESSWNVPPPKDDFQTPGFEQDTGGFGAPPPASSNNNALPGAMMENTFSSTKTPSPQISPAPPPAFDTQGSGAPNAFADPFGEGPAPVQQQTIPEEIESSGRSFESDPFGDGPAPTPTPAPPPPVAAPAANDPFGDSSAAPYDPFGEGSAPAPQASNTPFAESSPPPAHQASDPFGQSSPAPPPPVAAPMDPFASTPPVSNQVDPFASPPPGAQPQSSPKVQHSANSFGTVLFHSSFQINIF